MTPTGPTPPPDHRTEAIADFILALAQEGERSAVVLGASRADTALDELLKSFFFSHPGGSDNLFDPDRPLGTFSAKIAVAYRLGLIDRACEHALQMLRKIRNEFAHSTGHERLSDSRHKSRVAVLVAEANKRGTFYDELFQGLAQIKNLDLRAFCAATGVVICVVDFAAEKITPVKPSCRGFLDSAEAKMV
jgi:hypothetical protein